MNNKRVNIIGSVGVPACYGGWETLVDNLLDEVASNYHITVFCSGRAYATRQQKYKGANLRYINLKANGVQSIIYDALSMFLSLRSSDVMLILGVSGCIFLPFFKIFYPGKIIVAIDGLEWRREKWGAFASKFLKISEFLSVKFADVIISDNQAISEYVFDTYGKLNCSLIAYGADHVQENSGLGLDSLPYNLKVNNYAFKVARIEPENNIEIILESFARSNKIQLVVVGNWNSSKYGLALRHKYSEVKSILMLDPIYDVQRLDQLRSNCKVYIHGHSAGGTNPSLVEAMMLGLPVIAYDVSFNRYTTNNLCAYFKDEFELIELINLPGFLDSELFLSMGASLKSYAEKYYTWRYIGERYAEIFNQ
jgi:glycosyltransferase involved in cell wall biosynthesis